MNIFVAIILFVVMFLLGFMAATCTCLTKITRLEQENKTLAEWLSASRKVNEQLVDQCNEIMTDLESVVNGGHITASTITADKITVNEKERTNTD